MSRPLKMFMRGKRVRILQEILRRMAYPMHDQAGLFAASTRDAIKAFQKQQNLKVTGTVDDDLFKLLQQGSMPTKQETAIPADSQDTIETNTTELAPCNQHQLDALIKLLLDKNIISQEELQKQIVQAKPLRVTQPPLL